MGIVGQLPFSRDPSPHHPLRSHGKDSLQIIGQKYIFLGWHENDGVSKCPKQRPNGIDEPSRSYCRLGCRQRIPKQTSVSAGGECHSWWPGVLSGRRWGQMALPELIMTIMGTEGGLRHIARADSNLVISRAKVQFRKISCTLQFIEKLLNHGNEILIGNSGVVELPIMDANAPATILLFDQKNWTGLENGLELGWIIPIVSILATRRSISSFWTLP